MSSSTRRTRRSPGIALAGLVAGVLAGGTALGGCASAGPNTAASVGNARIGSAELAAAVSDLQATQAELGSAGSSGPAGLPDAGAQRTVLDQLIGDKILTAAAAKQGITVTPAEIAAERQELIDVLGIGKLPTPGMLAYRQELAKQGMPDSGAGEQAFLRDRVIERKLLAANSKTALGDQALAAGLSGTDIFRVDLMYTKDSASAQKAVSDLKAGQPWTTVFARYQVSPDTPMLDSSGASLKPTLQALKATGGDAGLKAVQQGSVHQGGAISNANEVAYFAKKLSFTDLKPLLVEIQNSNDPAAQQALTDLKAKAAAAAKVVVNPRFGSWDATQAQLGDAVSDVVEVPSASPSAAAGLGGLSGVTGVGGGTGTGTGTAQQANP